MSRSGRSRGGSFSLWPVVAMHYQALRDPETGRLGVGAWSALFVAPLLLGAFSGGLVWGGLDIRDGVSQVLAATALLVGAMLSLFVFITNLRVKVSESPTYAFRTRLNQLLGGTAAGCLYVAISTLCLAGLLAIAASVQFLRTPTVQPFAVGTVVFLIAHVVATLASVVRRLFGVYFDLFASDFNPTLGRVPFADEVGQGRAPRDQGAPSDGTSVARARRD